MLKTVNCTLPNYKQTGNLENSAQQMMLRWYHSNTNTQKQCFSLSLSKRIRLALLVHPNSLFVYVYAILLANFLTKNEIFQPTSLRHLDSGPLNEQRSPHPYNTFWGSILTLTYKCVWVRVSTLKVALIYGPSLFKFDKNM